MKELNYIEFKDKKEQVIIFDKSVKKINFDQIMFDIKENMQPFVLKVNLIFNNGNKCTFPMAININKNSHRDDNNSTYQAIYSFDLTYVEKIIVSSNELLSMKLFYHFEKN